MAGASAAGEPALVPTRGRIVAIDIVRGLAIMWVILYHLWTDIKFPHILSVRDVIKAVPDRIGEGAFPGSLTAITDVLLRTGYLGVPLFMTLSGLSLTLVAMRREMLLSETPRFFLQRFRRVMIPYWAGLAYTLLFLAGIAFVQWQRHGGDSFLDYYRNGDVHLDTGQLLAGLLMVPRAFRNEWQFAPEGSLWFVLIIVQYYLLFPFLLIALKRIGPWLFLLAALAVELAFLSAAVAIDGNLFISRHLIETMAPFRLFEFALGMAGGYLMVRRPSLMLEYTQAPLDIAGIVFLGLLLFVGGCMIEANRGSAIVLQAPMVALGMSLICLPLVMKVPGKLETGVPGRVLAWIGVISYTVLIVNEPMRSITHHMRVEHARFAWQFLWVGVLYIPLTLLLARPAAVLLGLVERDVVARPTKTGAPGGGGELTSEPALHH